MTKKARTSASRDRIAQLLRSSGPVFSVEHCASVLEMESDAAARQLADWARQGWLKRIKHGFYAPIPMDAISSEQVLEDVWVVVPTVFAPAYVGGWSAAEHWGLTEQIFSSICVLTSKPIKNRSEAIQGQTFSLKKIKKENFFGLKILWKGSVKINISDPHRTIADMLNDPALGGGISHVEKCLLGYLESQHFDQKLLLSYLKKLGNKTAFKRLGFLVEGFDGEKYASIIKVCQQNLSEGSSKLDSEYQDLKTSTRWKLLIPKNWSNHRHD